MTKAYQWGDSITLSDAARLYAERDSRPHEDVRTANQRARSAIARAQKNGLLPDFSATGERCFPVEKFVGWAISQGQSQSWLDWPADVVRQQVVSMSAPPVVSTMHKREYLSLDEANRALAELQVRCRTLEEELEMLRPIGKRVSETNAKKQAAAKKPRKK